MKSETWRSATDTKDHRHTKFYFKDSQNKGNKRERCLVLTYTQDGVGEYGLYLVWALQPKLGFTVLSRPVRNGCTDILAVLIRMMPRLRGWFDLLAL